MQESLLEDRQLLQAIGNGDKAAFDHLFQKYYPTLCAYGSRFVELEDAEEIVEDIMLWIWENANMLGFIESSFSNYLYKIVYNRAIMCMRKQEVRLEADTKFYQEMQEIWSDIDGQQLDELYNVIEEAVSKLPPSYQEAFRMHRFEGYSYKDIAQQLNVSPKTIDYRIQQALKILRVELKDYLPLFFLLATTIEPFDWPIPMQ